MNAAIFLKLFVRSSTITIILFCFFAYIFSFSLEQTRQAGLFPMGIGLIGMGLTGAQFLKEISKMLLHMKHVKDGTEPPPKTVKDAAGAVDFEMSEEEESLSGRIAAAEQFGWLFALVSGLYLLGFYITIPAIVGLYLFRYRESWLMVGGLTAGAWLMVWAIFDNLLNLPFPRGLLFIWFS